VVIMQLPVLVRNAEAGPLVFTDASLRTHVEWAGAGDDTGEDVQVVPEEFFANPAFIKVITRGSLVVENPEDNPELSATLEKVMGRSSIAAQREAALKRRTASTQASTEAIEHTTDKDVLGEECIGPDARGGNGKCGALVNLSSAKKKDTPPLCEKHAKLATEFVPTVDVTGDKQTTKWVRVTMGRREKEIEA
jgi:hypothetical protein